MKNLKSILAFILTGIFTIASLYLTGCSDSSNPLGSGYPGGNLAGDDPDQSGVTVKVVKENSGYTFRVINNLQNQGIINDFHIQLGNDVSIRGWGSPWRIDTASTDTSKGKIGVETGQHGHPIQNGDSLDVLWVLPSYKVDAYYRYFDWQATCNGAIVDSGTGYFKND